MVNVSLRISLVEALLECPCIRQRSTRDALVEQLSSDLRTRLSRHDIDRVDVLSIVGRCCDWEGGLDELVETVRGFETDKSLPFQRTLQVYRQIKSETERITLIDEAEDVVQLREKGQRDFVSLTQGFCDQIGWEIAESDNDHALLQFQMSSGRSQVVLIVPYDSALEFSVPSRLVFDREDDLPHRLSTLLLLRNAQSKYSFWTIEATDNRYFYSCMQNARTELLDTSYFKRVVETLVEESDAFEQFLDALSQEQLSGEVGEGPRWLDFSI